MRINSTLYYILKDHLGSASVVTNASGVIVGEQRCYSFPHRGLRCETCLTTGSIFTDKLFTGQREMAGLGIYPITQDSIHLSWEDFPVRGRSLDAAKH